MVRKLVLPLALLLTSGLAAQETLVVHFPIASAELGAKDEAALRALCDRTDIARVIGITLKGHTDVRGGISYNEALSARRVEAVREVLRTSCLRDVEMNSAWSGEMEPLSEALTEDAHAGNRRVEVHLEFDNDRVHGTRQTFRHPKLVPLMPLADVPVQLFTVDPSVPIEFITSDSVRVRMSADAIVDEDGDAVRGQVEISYRSFNGGWDAIASGVPMHVGIGPDAGHMESLGMFEVYASQSGRQLQLREGEAISLTPPGQVQRTADYRDWTLDKATGEWREMQATSTTAAPGFTSALSAACARYMKDLEDMPAMPDTMHFLARLASNEYCHLTPCSPTGMPYARDKDQLISPYANKDIPAITVEIVRGAYRWQHVTGFRIELAQERAHTEWLAFPRDRVWAYNGPMSKRAFNTQVARRHFYQDILFEQTDDPDQGIIRLKDRGQWVELPVDLSFLRAGRRDSLDLSTELSQYCGRLQAKQKRFDHRLDEKISTTRDRIIRTKARAWSDARRVMMASELAMTAQEFHVYAEEAYRRDMQQLFASTVAADDNVATSFAMRGFGLYNCDRIMQQDAVTPSVVAVVDADGAAFRWTKAYGVMDGQKAVITYWGNGTGRDDSMILSRKMSSVLFIGPNGKMLIAHRPGDVARGSKLVLQGEPLEQPKSAEELQALAKVR